MKLPIQAQPVTRKASVTKTYQKLTDAIVPSVDCGECNWKSSQCVAETGLDFSIDIFGTIKDILKGEHNWPESCRWYAQNCGPCVPPLDRRQIIRHAM